MLTELIAEAQGAERAGEWTRSLELYQSALDQARETADAIRTAEVLRWIGRVHRLRGNSELASHAYHESLAVAEEHGLTMHIASALNVIAMLEQAQGNVDEAEALYVRG